MIYIDN